ncbi:VOC family protein [Pseudozobellia thermophila]|uniref:Catechol 2,3-dioxygenase n=1 Tax=Pseudozobellia thermophila TaxID=192903 RepID=A0A1M6LHI1_9FLAO|nr:VOC family protein [Pseudozobellia thermophila]SHJ70643.1 Catechol 2,3-dioxygenase [Pseudozobellia thermophila]
MKKFFVLLPILYALPLLTSAQSFDFSIDHLALVVEDSDVSADFYGNILGLEETPHPDRAPGFRWFVVSGRSQIHLIEKDVAPFEKNKSMHLCLSTQDLDGVIAHLEKNGIPYWDWPGKKGAVTLRTDGVRQIYLQDPDAYWIEINDAKH